MNGGQASRSDAWVTLAYFHPKGKEGGRKKGEGDLVQLRDARLPFKISTSPKKGGEGEMKKKGETRQRVQFIGARRIRRM